VWVVFVKKVFCLNVVFAHMFNVTTYKVCVEYLNAHVDSYDVLLLKTSNVVYFTYN